MDDLERALEVALGIAQAAGKIGLGHFRKDLKRERKADGTWVSEADWAIEAQIRLRLSRAFPDHNILGEEEGLTAAGGGEPNEGAPTWIVDPIDETENFIAGIPIWGVLMGLRIDDELVLGVCEAPALGESWTGAQGLGARRNGTRVEVDPIAELSEATVSHGGSRWFTAAGLDGFLAELIARARRDRGFGGFWSHLLVASGSIHVMVEPSLRVWDYAAPAVIVRAAGGKVTQFDGSELADHGSCLTTNGKLHDEVKALVP